MSACAALWPGLQSRRSSVKQQLEVAKELERSAPPQTSGADEGLAPDEGRAPGVKTELPATGTDEQRAASTVAHGESRLTHKLARNRKNLIIALAASLLLVAGISFILNKAFFPHRTSPLASFQTMKISRLTSV